MHNDTDSVDVIIFYIRLVQMRELSGTEFIHSTEKTYESAN